MKFNKENFKERIYDNINRVKKTHTAWFMLIFIFLLWRISSNLSEYNEINALNAENLVKNAQYVNYYDSSTGVLTKYKQERFDASREKNIVAKVLADYLIQSAYSLTDDYKNLYFENAGDLYRSNPMLQEFFKHYIYRPTSSEQDKLALEDTIKDWEQIMKWFRLAIHDNDLPGIIDKKYASIGYATWTTSNEKFNISIEVPVQTTSRNNNNKIIAQKGIAVITASGYFNPLWFDEINPRGLKFTSVRLTHPVVDHTQR